MRKIIFCLMGGLFLFSCTTTGKGLVKEVKEEKPEYSIVGLWVYENEEFAGAELFFEEDNVVTLSMKGESVLGSYTIDYTVSPLHLDVEWPELGVVRTIIRFLDNNKFQLEDNEVDAERPEGFSENSQLLLRLK